MATSEQLLISHLLVFKDLSLINKHNVTSDTLIRYTPELLFIEKNGIPSVSVFKSKFPDFRVLRVEKDELEKIIFDCKNNKIRYETVKLLKISAKKLNNGIGDYSEIASYLEENAKKINMLYGVSKDVDILKNAEDILDKFKERSIKIQSGEIIGIPFSVPTLDKYIGGMLAPDMITVAARMANFKTWMMIRFASSALLNNKKVLFISLEMSKEEIAYRVWTMLSRLMQKSKVNKKLILPNSRLLSGQENLVKVEKIVNYLKDKINGNFIIPEIRGKFSIENTKYKIEQHKPDVVFFDYFGLAVGGNGKIDNWMEAARASNVCKEIARTYNIPFVLASQVNRTGAEQIPKLNQLSITDSIGADSDRVFTLQKKDNETLILYCAKNRHGKEGWKVYFDIDIDKGKIEEVSSVRDNEDEDDE